MLLQFVSRSKMQSSDNEHEVVSKKGQDEIDTGAQRMYLRFLWCRCLGEGKSETPVMHSQSDDDEDYGAYA